MSNYNPNSVRLSACRVRWGGRDLGMTKGGVDVTIKTDTHPVTVDQYGNGPINEVILGRTINIKAPFAETDLDNLYAMMRLAGATMNDLGTVASGTVTYSAVPVANDTVVLNGHTFTFVTAAPGLDQVLIGGTAAATLQNLLTVIQQSSDPNVQAGIYTATATALNIAYFQSGLAGNSFTLAKTGTTGTTSGATLTGGLAGTRNVSLGTSVGASLFSTAAPLVLHPYDKADNDLSDDLTVFLANSSGNITYAYKIDAERVYQVEFTGYPVPATKALCKFGV
jgi:hypothetical protein